jgi:hypothetical protein
MAQSRLQSRKSELSESIPASTTAFMADETILMALSALSSIVHPLSALREGRIVSLSNDRSKNISEIGIRNEEEKNRRKGSGDVDKCGAKALMSKS